ncbi:relaxase/mobilization nuclease domain-containing protein [Helicobacter winghamensis]|uniref:relaxase/mobilization nuclease domain-containing protein n=1 Tax=Helicobacter winghamensis TaxID=157268 RepID=UPI0018A3E546|nr:hypothetical protein [Helicobacter winghamensis]QOQ98590.1 hypothetical protein A0Z60_03180 [Helicobacter winghamensis]
MALQNNRFSKYLSKKSESLFFDFEEIKSARAYYEKQSKQGYVFNHKKITNDYFYSNSNNINGNDLSNKQVMVKLIKNHDKKGTKNSISYIIRNSELGFGINERGELVDTKTILKEWGSDFSNKDSTKESWHLVFSIKEIKSENNIKALEESVKMVMQKHFSLYKYIAVTHKHQNRPHIHIIINKTNMLTQKKIHFKNKTEIRDFFNEIREDFKDELNYRGLSYHNKFRCEKDYKELKEKIIKETHKKIHISTDISNKQILLNNKKVVLRAKIKNLYMEKKIKDKEFQELFSKAYSTKFKDYEAFLQLKNAMEKVKKEKDLLKNRILSEMKTIKEIEKEHKELELRKNHFDYKKDFAELAEKKKYVEFLEQDYKKNKLNKSQYQLLRDLKLDIFMAEKFINENIQLILNRFTIDSKVLGCEANGFNLVKTRQDLVSNLMILKKISSEKHSYYVDYHNKLVRNIKYVEESINEKYNKMLKAYENGKIFSSFHIKEFKKLSDFLKKDSSNQIGVLEARLAKIKAMDSKDKSLIYNYQESLKKDSLKNIDTLNFSPKGIGR